MRVLSFGLVAFAFVLAGCDSSDTSYPGAGDFPEADLSTLSSAAAGSYNVLAFVTATRKCPPDVSCPTPDGLELAETVDASSGGSAFVVADDPGQFEITARYRFSIRVQRSQARGPQDEEIVAFTLLGADRL